MIFLSSCENTKSWNHPCSQIFPRWKRPEIIGRCQCCGQWGLRQHVVSSRVPTSWHRTLALGVKIYQNRWHVSNINVIQTTWNGGVWRLSITVWRCLKWVITIQKHGTSYTLEVTPLPKKMMLATGVSCRVPCRGMLRLPKVGKTYTAHHLKVYRIGHSSNLSTNHFFCGSVNSMTFFQSRSHRPSPSFTRLVT